MRWELHGLTVEGVTNDATLRARWQRAFASRPASPSSADLSFELNVVAEVPSRPAGEPHFRQRDLLEYYLEGRTATAHFPRYGQLRLDLANGVTEGRIVPAALATYGVFEDLLAIGLSPHLRRRGLFLMHAFAAARGGRAAVLVGGIAAGKTTTGMSLLDAGWKLLSNDSPIVRAGAEILSYPGLLAGYPDTFARFDATAGLAGSIPETGGRRKLSVAAEHIWPGVWIDCAPAGALLFPQIESRPDHAADPLSAPEALRRLLPHAVEQWDREMIPEHLKLLRRLVESAPAFLLRLGPNVKTIPAVLSPLLPHAPRNT